jgi:hypothetical protein
VEVKSIDKESGRKHLMPENSSVKVLLKQMGVCIGGWYPEHTGRIVLGRSEPELVTLLLNHWQGGQILVQSWGPKGMT